MTTRKGLGKGLGSGYKNLIKHFDARVHSNSAKGIKLPQRLGTIYSGNLKRQYNVYGDSTRSAVGGGKTKKMNLQESINFLNEQMGYIDVQDDPDYTNKEIIEIANAHHKDWINERLAEIDKILGDNKPNMEKRIEKYLDRYNLYFDDENELKLKKQLGGKMSKQRAFDIVNATGGICATKEEVKEALKVLKKSERKPTTYITEGQPYNHKPSPYKLIKKEKGGLAIFANEDGKLERFVKRKDGHSGWGLKVNGVDYEFVGSIKGDSE